MITSKFALGVLHYSFEQELKDQGVPLDSGTMSRYVEHTGNTPGDERRGDVARRPGSWTVISTTRPAH